MQHPGQELQEKLKTSGMSRKELAIRTGVTEKHINTILNGSRNISASFARKLSYVFEDTSYWMDLQAKYDEDQQRQQEENNISQEEIDLLRPLQEFMAYCISRGYLHNNCGDSEKVMQLREFLQISNLTLIPQITYNAAYRAQLTSNVKVNPFVLFAWQRLCEKETEDIPVKDHLDKELLRSSIDQIKQCMFGNINEGTAELQRIFAECGIAFRVVQNFKGAPVQGFIKETTDKRLLLCLTIRGKRADRFWFTLFHEIAHILNGDYKTRFVDFDTVSGKAEERADKFASDTLIPSEEYRQFITSDDCTSWNRIVAFAESVNVKPFVILGRLQRDNYLDWSDYTNKITRYDWA